MRTAYDLCRKGRTSVEEVLKTVWRCSGVVRGKGMQGARLQARGSGILKSYLRARLSKALASSSDQYLTSWSCRWLSCSNYGCRTCGGVAAVWRRPGGRRLRQRPSACCARGQFQLLRVAQIKNTNSKDTDDGRTSLSRYRNSSR